MTGKREPVLNELQQRIVGALQVDGRATWRKIATVLGEPERTVARYGNELLSTGHVTVAAIRNQLGSVVGTFSCLPGAARLSVESLAQREDTTYSYLTTGIADVVTEVHYDGDTADILTLQLPATPGISQYATYPVLKYFKTIRGWRAGVLTVAEEGAMAGPYGTDRISWNPDPDLGGQDVQIIDILKRDGRATIESISRQVGISETSASRRLEAILSTAQATIRTLVEPGLMGLPVEAQLWVETSPHLIDGLGTKLAELPQVRYAAALAGDYQLLIDLTLPTQMDLYRFITAPMWGEGQTRIRTAMVVRARKRGGRLFDIS
ncbi:Lrp/AsnC family transcriptional regulator [Glutamicibacter sp. MNS18]|uniref:Lrp/AsnC family transcriptional regulator n=1 Tax=Glutamicibacter sp. MNS18 TaxID=2989817 RepID=UPI002236ACF5|nr:Lrp/AsnC family transcriptional regulator [Glutamicibacter sp. MNS18]MCW4467059.1 Lrp/AsnC family transcriptional regulator [Glutamicibacter sp. MNS18]